MNESRKVWGVSENGEFEYVLLTNDLLAGGLDVIRQGFFPNEAVSIATEVCNNPAAGEELLELCRHTADDGVSLVAVEKATGVVAAAAFNKLQVKSDSEDQSFFEIFRDTKCKHDSSKGLMQFMIDVDGRVDIFDKYNVDNLIEIMFLATRPQYRKLGLGIGVCEATLTFAKALKDGIITRHPLGLQFSQNPSEDKPIKLVAAMFTSPVSQKIGKKLKFDELIEISYDEFVFKNETFSAKLGPTVPSTILVAKEIV